MLLAELGGLTVYNVSETSTNQNTNSQAESFRDQFKLYTKNTVDIKKKKSLHRPVVMAGFWDVQKLNQDKSY